MWMNWWVCSDIIEHEMSKCEQTNGHQNEAIETQMSMCEWIDGYVVMQLGHKVSKCEQTSGH
jgi:hypothetical protein